MIILAAILSKTRRGLAGEKIWRRKGPSPDSHENLENVRSLFHSHVRGGFACLAKVSRLLNCKPSLDLSQRNSSLLGRQ